jgi:Domain of unknown function (DUF4412)
MRTLLFLILFGLVSALAFADMTLVQKIQTGAMMGQPVNTDTMTLVIKGSKARMDFSSRKISQIVDLNAHKIYRINVEKKQVMVTSTDLPEANSDVVSKIASDTKIDVRKTGDTATINGYKCEEWVVTMSGPMSMTLSSWVTQDLDWKEYEPFKSFGLEMPKTKGSGSMAEMKGISIKSTSKMTLMGEVIDSSTEMQSISHDTVSASLFEIPKDYQVMDMPKMPVPRQQH